MWIAKIQQPNNQTHFCIFFGDWGIGKTFQKVFVHINAMQPTMACFKMWQ
jgi:hypothetical protein